MPLYNEFEYSYVHVHIHIHIHTHVANNREKKIWLKILPSTKP